MAKIGIPGKSKKQRDKNVLKVRNPGNSGRSNYSRNSKANRFSNNSKGPRSSGSSLGPRNYNSSRNSRSSIWSRNPGPKKPRNPLKIIFMIIIIFAFICGLALGISMIVSDGDSDTSNSGQVEYMNVTKNITQYENDSYDLEDENGTQISYYDFDENVTEGQNITAYNATNAANIY